MTLNTLVSSRAMKYAGEMPSQQLWLLDALCDASVSYLTARLRDGLTPDDCKDDFVIAASLMALGALTTMSGDTPAEQLTAGDFTIRKGTVQNDAAYSCMLDQAEMIMAPYLKDRFSFMGV